MGCTGSKPSSNSRKFPGEGQQLGSSSHSYRVPAAHVTKPPLPLPPPRTQMGMPVVPVPALTQSHAPALRQDHSSGSGWGGGHTTNREANREAISAAAEKRRQEDVRRGASKQGSLSKQLERQKRGENTETGMPERVIWD